MPAKVVWGEEAGRRIFNTSILVTPCIREATCAGYSTEGSRGNGLSTFILQVVLQSLRIRADYFG